MDEKTNPDVVLETVEKDKDQVQKPDEVGCAPGESLGICEHEEKLLEDIQ